MALKVTRTGSEEGRWIKELVCGEPGAGKTLTASTWPQPLYVNAEGGLLSLQDKDIPKVDATDTSTLMELQSVLAQPPNIREKELGDPVETVVVDTFDEIARLFMKERMEHTGKDSLAIQDWGWLGEQLRAMVRAYRNLPLNVIFNCHLKTVTDEETGKMFLKPAIQGAMGDEIAGYVDLAVVLTARPVTKVVEGKNVREIVRVMQTFPDSRMPWVKDRSGRLPMEFPINFQNDYERLNKFVFGGRKAAPIQDTVIQPGQAEDEAVVAEVVAPVPMPGVDEKGQPPKKKATSRAKKVDDAAVEAPPKTEPEVPKVDDVQSAPEPEIEPPAPAEVLEPEPLPEVAPEPEPEALPEPAQQVEQASAPEPEVSEESVPSSETPVVVENALMCTDCGGEIHSKDQAELSFIRFRRKLCRTCMGKARARK